MTSMISALRRFLLLSWLDVSAAEKAVSDPAHYSRPQRGLSRPVSRVQTPRFPDLHKFSKDPAELRTMLLLILINSGYFLPSSGTGTELRRNWRASKKPPEQAYRPPVEIRRVVKTCLRHRAIGKHGARSSPLAGKQSRRQQRPGTVPGAARRRRPGGRQQIRPNVEPPVRRDFGAEQRFQCGRQRACRRLGDLRPGRRVPVPGGGQDRRYPFGLAGDLP